MSQIHGGIQQHPPGVPWHSGYIRPAPKSIPLPQRQTRPQFHHAKEPPARRPRLSSRHVRQAPVKKTSLTRSSISRLEWLAAGYRRVVSTMWEIGDRHAPQVASDFYQYLWIHRPEGSGTRFDGSLSAYALHHATQELRGPT
ncbi:hypothetical protein FA13DRAFT_1896470 [Coprinellus micaceus]|uniref:CHAT domain-containing protein n=1 Tax=Coprinellus micaceus TaxID=71717 RepID=A0A4Y7SVK0_COPMI|nr:hypothetical protein FA13DRAFT_1896470 [Coprinellus micaceus]